MIRRAGCSDIQAIKEIAARAYSPYIPRLGKEPAPMLADFGRHIRDDFVIVFEQQCLLGYAVLLKTTTYLLDNIAVDSTAQRQGVGRALIDHVERYLISTSCVHYDLYTNIVMTENVQWYRRLGFVELRRVTEKGFDRVYFRKRLPPGSV